MSVSLTVMYRKENTLKVKGRLSKGNTNFGVATGEHPLREFIIKNLEKIEAQNEERDRKRETL